MKAILAFDHGTSGMKAGLVSVNGEVLGHAARALPTDHLPGGGAEQDPEGWWRALLETGRELTGQGLVPPGDIAGVCVSSTFSTTVAADEAGRPVCPAMTWMDGRGARHVKAAMAGFPSVLGYGLGNVLRWVPRTAGAPSLSGKDDIGHVLFLMAERPDLYARTRWFLPSKDWLNMRLTGRVCASRDSMTLFWVTDTRDPGNVRYDPGLIRRLGLSADRLPPLVDSVDVVGGLAEDAARELGLAPGLPVVAGSPDHQCAAVGAGAVEDFMAHLYIGTSSWLQCPVPFKKTDVLHSIASFPFSVPGKYYAVNEQDMAGGCLEFAARFMGADAASVAAWAEEAAPGSGGVLFAPWLNGERTPVDDPHARGAFFNLGKTTTRAHLCRAVLEGVAANTRWSLGYVEKFCGRRLEPIRFVGGGARSRLWCQILADSLDREIWQMADPRQANARGAAFIAAVGLGLARWEDLPNLAPVAEKFLPDPAGRAAQDEVFSRLLGLYRRNRRAFAKMNPGGCSP